METQESAVEAEQSAKARDSGSNGKKHFFTKVPEDAIPGKSRLRFGLDNNSGPLQVLVPETAKPGQYIVLVAGKDGSWKSCLVNSAGADGLALMSGATEVSCEVLAPENATPEDQIEELPNSKGARDTKKFVLQVPDGSLGGEPLRVDVGDGQQLAIKVPNNARPGQELVLELDDDGAWKCALMPLSEPPKIGAETSLPPSKPRHSQSQPPPKPQSTLAPETSPEPPSLQNSGRGDGDGQMAGATPEFFMGLLQQLVTSFPKVLEQFEVQLKGRGGGQKSKAISTSGVNLDEALALAAKLSKTETSTTKGDLQSAGMHIEALVEEVRRLEEKLEEQHKLGQALASEVADTSSLLRQAEQEKQAQRDLEEAVAAEQQEQERRRSIDHSMREVLRNGTWYEAPAYGTPGMRPGSANATPGPSVRAMSAGQASHVPAPSRGQKPVVAAPATAKEVPTPTGTMMMMPFGIARGSAGNPMRQCTSPVQPTWRSTSPVPVAVQPLGSIRRAQSPGPQLSMPPAPVISGEQKDPLNTSWRSIPEIGNSLSAVQPSATAPPARRVPPHTSSSPLLASPRAPQAVVAGAGPCWSGLPAHR